MGPVPGGADGGRARLILTGGDDGREVARDLDKPVQERNDDHC